MDATDLMPAVDEAFERTSRGLAQWDDPHPPPDRLVTDDEYARVTDPAKWHIVGARVDAWLDVLAAEGLASVERSAPVEWEEPSDPIVTRADVVRPAVAGGLVLVVGRSRIDPVDDAGIVLAVGLPAVSLERIPDCGCDACDSGSADVLHQVDVWIGGIVRGELRHLRRPGCTISVIADAVRQASYRPDLPTDGWFAAARDDATPGLVPPPSPIRPFDVDAVLADPSGWREWSGPSWIG